MAIVTVVFNRPASGCDLPAQRADKRLVAAAYPNLYRKPECNQPASRLPLILGHQGLAEPSGCDIVAMAFGDRVRGDSGSAALVTARSEPAAH